MLSLGTACDAIFLVAIAVRDEKPYIRGKKSKL